MMTRKVTTRISLDSSNSLGLGVLITCCGKRQPIHRYELEPGQWWECIECEKPLVLRNMEGDLYFIGEKVFHETS